MQRAMEAYGRPKSRKRAPGFGTLVSIIIDQQVSVQAGAAIWKRLDELLGVVTPDAVLAAGEEGLRSAGLSGAKACYVSLGLPGLLIKVISTWSSLVDVERTQSDAN